MCRRNRRRCETENLPGSCQNDKSRELSLPAKKKTLRGSTVGNDDRKTVNTATIQQIQYQVGFDFNKME